MIRQDPRTSLVVNQFSCVMRGSTKTTVTEIILKNIRESGMLSIPWFKFVTLGFSEGIDSEGRRGSAKRRD